MKVFAIYGFTGSGKTTTIEEVIKELRKRNYSVGSVKEIHFEEFAIDTVGTNTYRHREAGSQLVTARGYNETDILYQERLPINEILKSYTMYDYVILEGVTDCNCPKILAARNEDDIKERVDDTVFAITGIITNTDYSNIDIPVINGVEDVVNLVDMIEEKVFDLLPDFDPKCCSMCGMSCRELCVEILKDNANYEDCILNNEDAVELFIEGEKVDMVPFVKKILNNAVVGVVKELEGYKEGKSIDIKIRS